MEMTLTKASQKQTVIIRNLWEQRVFALIPFITTEKIKLTSKFENTTTGIEEK